MIVYIRHIESTRNNGRFYLLRWALLTFSCEKFIWLKNVTQTHYFCENKWTQMLGNIIPLELSTTRKCIYLTFVLIDFESKINFTFFSLRTLPKLFVD